jgi:hypothetical protein
MRPLTTGAVLGAALLLAATACSNPLSTSDEARGPEVAPAPPGVLLVDADRDGQVTAADEAHVSKATPRQR